MFHSPHLFVEVPVMQVNQASGTYTRICVFEIVKGGSIRNKNVFHIFYNVLMQNINYVLMCK